MTHEVDSRFRSREDMEIFLRMSEDPWYFIASSARTWDEHEPNPMLKGEKPFPQWDLLRDATQAIHNNPATVILKSRQLMISWLFAAYCAWEIYFHTFTRVLVISKDQTASYAIQDRTRHILDHLPWEVRYKAHQEEVPGQEPTRHGVKYEKDKASILRLAGKSEAVFLPQSKSAGRGYPARVVLGDEMAFWAWAEEIYTGIEPTLSGGAGDTGPRGPKIVLSSTPNGVGTLHNKIYSNAESMGFAPVKLHHSRHPDRNPDTPKGRKWKAGTLKRLGKRRFAQEHGCEALQSGAVVFESDYLRIRTVEPSGEWVRKVIRQAERHGMESPFLLGIDTAEGSEGGDFNSLSVIHKVSGRQVAHFDKCCKPQIFAKLIKRFLDKFPGTIGVERNGPGGTLILVLQQMGYGDRLYYHLDYDQEGNKIGKVGWPTTSKTKPIMIDELEQGLREGEILLYEEKVIAQLMVYEYKTGGHHSGAPDGYHDDDVISLAIAWQMRKAAGRGVESEG